MRFKSDRQRRAVFARLNKFSEGPDDKVDYVKYPERLPSSSSRLLDLVESAPEPSAEDFNKEVGEMHKKILESGVESSLSDEDIVEIVKKLKEERQDAKDLGKWRKQSLNEELRYLYKKHPELTYYNRVNYEDRKVQLPTFEKRLEKLREEGKFSKVGSKDGLSRVSFDLDGVLAEYDGFDGYEVIGKPIKPMVKLVKDLHDEGHKVYLTTARLNPYPFEGKVAEPKVLDGTAEKYVMKWLDKNKLKDCFDSIGYDKKTADVYIDDRGLRYEDNPVETREFIESIGVLE
jgi:hypothetical protein